MVVSVTQAIAEFNSDFPDQFQQRLLQLVLSTYRTADRKRTEEFGHAPEGHEAAPGDRRARLKRDVRQLSKQFGISTVDVGAQNRDHHVRLVSGRTMLTVHSISSRRQAPRPAKFRMRYSAVNLELFDRQPTQPVFADDIDSYWILGHGPSRRNKSEPNFVVVGLPHPEKRQFVASFDLVAKFAVRSTAGGGVLPPEPVVRRRQNIAGDE